MLSPKTVCSFSEEVIAQVDVLVNKYDKSIMDDSSPVCNANTDDQGEKDDNGTATCRSKINERKHGDGPKSL